MFRSRSRGMIGNTTMHWAPAASMPKRSVCEHNPYLAFNGTKNLPRSDRNVKMVEATAMFSSERQRYTDTPVFHSHELTSAICYMFTIVRNEVS